MLNRKNLKVMKAIVKATAKCKGGFKGYFVKNVPGICSDEIHEEIPVFGTKKEANPIEFDPETENLYELCNVNPEMTELTIEFVEPETQLTANEQKVLKALVLNAQASDNGTEFLIDEVAAALNKSKKSVAATVGELQKKGLVDCYAKGYYFNGAVTKEGMAEFDKIEKTAKKSTIERNLKTAKEFQDAIKDCKSEAAKEYKQQAQATIEHYEAELAKENKADSKPEAPQTEVGNEPEKKIAKTARKVGDHHPTQPWIWKEYKPGKFDWRKDPAAPKNVIY
jgi:DNA-binding transcriptional regulator GbsR (MarR family)